MKDGNFSQGRKICIVFLIHLMSKEAREVDDMRIMQFMALIPQRFTSVVRHDWWNHYPIDDVGFRSDCELWLCHERIQEPGEILKLKCFHVMLRSHGRFFHRFEMPLQLGVKSIKDLQWDGCVYSFVDGETGEDLFFCKRFEATVTVS